MTVGTFEKWGAWLINVALIFEANMDGADVLLKGSGGITQVRIPGIAVKFAARYQSGSVAPAQNQIVWVSATRAVSTSRWLACDLTGQVVYDADSSAFALAGGTLAAATAFAASLPDQLA